MSSDFESRLSQVARNFAQRGQIRERAQELLVENSSRFIDDFGLAYHRSIEPAFQAVKNHLEGAGVRVQFSLDPSREVARLALEFNRTGRAFISFDADSDRRQVAMQSSVYDVADFGGGLSVPPRCYLALTQIEEPVIESFVTAFIEEALGR